VNLRWTHSIRTRVAYSAMGLTQKVKAPTSVSVSHDEKHVCIKQARAIALNRI
jgi:hypothetical protein